MLAAKSSRKRTPAAATSAGTTGAGERMTSWLRVPELVTALIIQKATLHRLLGRETLGASFVEVAVLGTGVSVILPSLMIGIDQGIVGERQQTFGEAVEGVLLYGREHFRGCLLAGIFNRFNRFRNL